MATTKIWPIKSGHLGKVIDYVADLFGHMPLTIQKTAGNDK